MLVRVPGRQCRPSYDAVFTAEGKRLFAPFVQGTNVMIFLMTQNRPRLVPEDIDYSEVLEWKRAQNTRLPLVVTVSNSTDNLRLTLQEVMLYAWSLCIPIFEGGPVPWAVKCRQCRLESLLRGYTLRSVRFGASYEFLSDSPHTSSLLEECLLAGDLWMMNQPHYEETRLLRTRSYGGVGSATRT